MKEYIISVSLTAVVAMIASALVPTVKRSELAPYVRLVSSFVIICVIISPLSKLTSCDPKASTDSFISSIKAQHPDVYEQSTYSALSKLSALQLSAALSNDICERFDIDASDLKLELQYTVNGDKAEYSHILVLLYGKAIFKNPAEIEKYVSGLCSVKCDCAIG